MDPVSFNRGFTKVRFEQLERRRMLSAAILADASAGATLAVTGESFAAHLGLNVDGGSTYIVKAARNADGTVSWTAVDGSAVSMPAGTNVFVGGTDGEVTLYVDPRSSKPSEPAAIPTSAPASRSASDMEMALGTVVQADGKVVVATLLGTNVDGDHNYSGQTFDRISLVRYEADGSLDTTFGTGGATTYTLGEPVTSDYWPGTVLADAQGRFLVSYYGGVKRFNADGSMDATFGTNGLADVRGANAIKLQADGKILMLESHKLSRLNADGSVDSSFAPYTLAIAGSRWGTAQLHDVTVGPDGSIYVVGEIRSANEGLDVQMTTGYLTKLDSTGAVDTTFANNGRFELGLSERKWESFGGVAVLPDGKVQVIGTYSFLTPFENPSDPGDLYRDDSGVILARFNADGSLDTSYGNAGVIKDTTMAMDDLFGMVVLDDGRLVASTYGHSGARLFVADADGSNRRMIDRGVDLQNDNPSHGYFDMTTRAPTIAPDGSIITGVGMGDLYDKNTRDASKTYWTRFTLDDLGGTAAKAPPDAVATPVAEEQIITTSNPEYFVGIDWPVEPQQQQQPVMPPSPTASTTFTRRADTNILGADAKDDLFASEQDVLV